MFESRFERRVRMDLGVGRHVHVFGSPNQTGTGWTTMKIVKHGAVIITKDRIQIEGWLVEHEDSDPDDATPEQLLLALTTDWALTQLKMELAKLHADVLRKWLNKNKERITNALPSAPESQSN